MLFPSHTTTYKLKLSQYTTIYTLMLMKGLVKFCSPQTFLKLLDFTSQKYLTLPN